jgi:hypothetical protein
VQRSILSEIILNYIGAPKQLWGTFLIKMILNRDLELLLSENLNYY